MVGSTETVTELGVCWERDDLGGGRVRHTQYLRPICYHTGANLARISTAWIDSGIVDRPHLIAASDLMVSVSDTGLRRIHPTRDPNIFIEIGGPVVKIGGTWTRVPFASATRAANTITWHRTQADLRITHGGHYCKLDLELLGGYVPEGNLVAFPVGLTGLTRNGVRILSGNNVVALLRAPEVYDAANPEAAHRAIGYEFASLAGQPYIVMTLPPLTGISRPVVDPTLTLQPDAAAGIDTDHRSGSADTNYGTVTTLNMANNFSSITRSGFIKFDLTSIPSGAVVTAGTLTLTHAGGASLNCTINVHQIMAANSGWTEAGLTWNKLDGTNAWAGSAGCSTANTDYSSTVDGSFSVGGSAPASGTAETIAIAVARAQAMLTANYGWIIRMATDNKLCQMFSSDHATAGYRPKLVVDYSTSSTAVLAGHYARTRRR